MPPRPTVLSQLPTHLRTLALRPAAAPLLSRAFRPASPPLSHRQLSPFALVRSMSTVQIPKTQKVLLVRPPPLSYHLP